MTARLSLEQITAWGLSPPALIDLAAALGCEAISLFVEAVNPESAGEPLVGNAPLVRDIRARLDATGVYINTLECFALTPATEVAAFEPTLAVGAELGGRTATAIVFDPDRARVTDTLAAFAELARAHGLATNIEFIALSEAKSLGDAVSLARAVAPHDVRIVIDTLHWTRSGGTPADLRALDPALLGAVQLCDGPAEMAPELQLFHEGFLQRMIPGEGAFAVTDFLRALPPGQLIGVEVPLQDLADAGVAVEERARRAIAGARRMIAAAGYR